MYSHAMKSGPLGVYFTVYLKVPAKAKVLQTVSLNKQVNNW